MTPLLVPVPAQTPTTRTEIELPTSESGEEGAFTDLLAAFDENSGKRAAGADAIEGNLEGAAEDVVPDIPVSAVDLEDAGLARSVELSELASSDHISEVDAVVQRLGLSVDESAQFAPVAVEDRATRPQQGDRVIDSDQTAPQIDLPISNGTGFARSAEVERQILNGATVSLLQFDTGRAAPGEARPNRQLQRLDPLLEATVTRRVVSVPVDPSDQQPNREVDKVKHSGSQPHGKEADAALHSRLLRAAAFDEVASSERLKKSTPEQMLIANRLAESPSDGRAVAAEKPAPPTTSRVGPTINQSVTPVRQETSQLPPADIATRGVPLQQTPQGSEGIAKNSAKEPSDLKPSTRTSNGNEVRVQNTERQVLVGQQMSLGSLAPPPPTTPKRAEWDTLVKGKEPAVVTTEPVMKAIPKTNQQPPSPNPLGEQTVLQSSRQSPVDTVFGKAEGAKTGARISNDMQEPRAPSTVNRASTPDKGPVIEKVEGILRFDAASPVSERAVSPATAPQPVTTPEQARHVAQQIATALPTTLPGTTEILLQPEELGRVRMTLTVQDGAMTLMINAERPETTELMRRHIDQLIQTYRQMGFDSLNLSFAGSASRQGAQVSGMSHAFEEAELEEPPPQVIPLKATAPDGRLDLRM